MKKTLLPEEKLLRLIKEGQKTILSLPAKKKLALKPDLLLTARILLFFLITFSAVYLISLFIRPGNAFNKTALVNKLSRQEKTGFIRKEPKPYSYYAEQLPKRKIFASLKTYNQRKEDQVKSEDLLKDIKLIGIISVNPPQAIIEDAGAQKTYYLHKGEFIKELEIRDISEEKITLNYQEQNYDLYL